MSVFNEKVIVYNNNRDSESFHLSAIGILLPDKNYVVAREGAGSENSIIEYIVEGVGYIEINGITSRVKKGDCYCIRAGTPHRYYSDEVNPYTKLWLSLSGSYTDEWLNMYGITLSPFIRRLDITDEWQTIRSCIEGNPEKLREDIVFATHSIIYRLGNAPTEYSSASAAVYGEAQVKDRRRLMLDAKKYIEKSATQFFSLDELARLLSISKSQLIRLFKKQYDITPYAYSVECKLNIACTLLKTSNISIDEIAARLSFYDRNHFNKSFRNAYGVTPAAYRYGYFQSLYPDNQGDSDGDEG